METLASKTRLGLLQLPTELYNGILAHLDKDSLDSLRATCSTLKRVIPFSINRVFVSANSLNIKVFREIADSETYRHDITEIIWDDARLSTGPEDQVERNRFWYSGGPDDIMTENGCPLWFQARRLDSEEPGWNDQNTIPTFDSLDLEESWDYYKDLLEDQRKILESNDDIKAFKYGLKQFPNLKRVTVTPSAHGRIGQPMFRTPMIRDFPHGLDYPLPKEWPCTTFEEPIDEHPWMPDEAIPIPDQECYWMYRCNPEEYRAKWRGFRVVTRALVECGKDHNVTELMIGGTEIGTGVNCRVFDQRCQEYDDLVTLLQRPGFRRLDLDLFTGMNEHHNWVSYRSGLLRDALAQAKDLEHISLRTTTDIAGQIDSDNFWEFSFPLRTIFPVENWPNLQHFGMCNMFVRQDDLMSILVALPNSLRSVELSRLTWASLDDGYGRLLEEMRTRLDWRLRPVEKRPRVRMSISTDGVLLEFGHYIEIDDMVHSFLYSDGHNPFPRHYDTSIDRGEGAVERDLFNLEFRAHYE
ncbi:hypothetical protein FLONG3_4953 [Fusarium longipes]|uniref:F-box domain-containing protein n=1 Tax=Fusarium longipes TaxID=694270 RepID=A0A395SWK3_9HYPO|nr:hypothetical protein FLONG3_4953 [Fusarium longipes]